ncbi:hypothetical protein [Streptacidiphilus jiangxiensis]|uniref:Multicomponent Na+:H+ antiporter subunit E n=1 Tax=Streptacidiphilus jiangxiensis TaxID=235985 RepID=A0A1H7NTU5_STRJI|nr:hypothetical protein [Streptacidiphilus jiangxiensis]SEL26983.1 hypothetical protein SAMN05414137_10775 [Streptacidiphilus jiangxiensis]
MRAVVEFVVWWAVLAGLTVVFISSVSPVELLVAGVAAVGGAFAAVRMRRVAGVRLTGVRRAARAVLALPRAVLRGLVVLVAALAHPTDATVRRIRLRPGADAGWAGALVGASPDTCVIDVPSPDEVVVHALRPGEGPVERLIARGGGGAP